MKKKAIVNVSIDQITPFEKLEKIYNTSRYKASKDGIVWEYERHELYSEAVKLCGYQKWRVLEHKLQRFYEDEDERRYNYGDKKYYCTSVKFTIDLREPNWFERVFLGRKSLHTSAHRVSETSTKVQKI